MPKPAARDVFADRLRTVRLALGLSQAELGVRMGLPEDVASTRLNRYERGVHLPDIETAERMAAELGVPIGYLLTQDERLADAILKFSKLSIAAQDKILAQLDALGGGKKDKK